jgi:hypothetical protein
VGIQCKRYQDPISIPEIAVELAKVAMTAAVQKSRVVEQYIITTGKVRVKAKHALRESDRDALRAAARKAAADNDDLKGLREQAVDLGLSPDALADEHVASLENLVVWSGDEFDAALGSRSIASARNSNRNARVFASSRRVLEMLIEVHRVVQAPDDLERTRRGHSIEQDMAGIPARLLDVVAQDSRPAAPHFA